METFDQLVNENFILNKEKWLEKNSENLKANFTKTYDNYNPKTDRYKSPSDFFDSLEQYKNVMYQGNISHLLKDDFTFYKHNQSDYHYDDFGSETKNTIDLFLVLYDNNKISYLSKINHEQDFNDMELDIQGDKTIELLNSSATKLPNGSKVISYLSLPDEVKTHFFSMFEEQIKLEKAINFHQKNKYPGKIPNISADGVNGALNQVLKTKFGFKLSKEELTKVHQQIRQEKAKGISR